MGTNQQIGASGEDAASEFLQQRGYTVIERNFRSGHCEIDLIAEHNRTLIFIEVKTRTGTGFGMPEEFVNYSKVRLIKKAAENYIFSRNWMFDVRFDIVSILIRPDGSRQIRQIEDAFY